MIGSRSYPSQHQKRTMESDIASTAEHEGDEMANADRPQQQRCSAGSSDDQLSQCSSEWDGEDSEGESVDVSELVVQFGTAWEGDYEDAKAEVISQLMKNHEQIVSSFLVERSNLMQSITWLSRHVPGCVLKSLFESIAAIRESKMGGSQTDGSSQPPTASIGQSVPQSPAGHLPLSKHHDGALLFVDISGFTKLSVTLDVENLSNVINSYFDMITEQITIHGGDVLKFAGDAIFAEWKASRRKPNRDLEQCVLQAAECAAAIVSNCSDYVVVTKASASSTGGISKKTSLVSRQESSAMMRRTMELSVSAKLSRGDDIERHKGEPTRRHSDNDNYDDNRAQRERKLRTGSLRRKLSVELMQGLRPSLCVEVATLNVKCGIGAGHMVGIHVGDDISRREYLILGDPVNQVAKAESIAQHGEAFASPEAVRLLANSYHIKGEWGEAVKNNQPFLIANHGEFCIDTGTYDRAFSRRESFTPCDGANILHLCEQFHISELQLLKRTLSLYVHPVVVNDDSEWLVPVSLRYIRDQERHLAEAELRNVYTCFVTPLVDYELTGDKTKDQKLFNLLNDIMNLTSRELDKVQGHLRQYILDDKGLVLICTFGLRGSMFLNMIAQRAMPFTLSIKKTLEEELGVKSRIGATFGRAYCGVVGGSVRHEFSVLGPSVNFSARLMVSKDNPGILVDKNVRLLTSQVFFKPLPAVKAKGFDEPMPIFEPIQTSTDDKWGQRKHKNFIGRSKEIMHIMRKAKDLVFGGTASKLVFLSAVSGTGKSALMAKSTKHVKAMLKKVNKKVITLRNTSREGDSRVPFSSFRTIFKEMLSHVRNEDEDSQASILANVSRRTSASASLDEAKRQASATGADITFDEQCDSLSLTSQSSRGSFMSTDVTRFQFICQQLSAPPEFMSVVGHKLLGLRDRNAKNTGATGSGPSLEMIIDFMVKVFIRCTKHANIVILTLDDTQWMDAMSWKVVQEIFQRADNVLILCGSRPPSSNPLTIDTQFQSDLQGQFQKDGSYSEMSLTPFTGPEVEQLIASTLGTQVNEIDRNFSHDIFTTSGGMPHYLTYILDGIKRKKLATRLENGILGVHLTGDDDKLGFGSVGELLLYRLDALDSSVRTVLHLSAVLGTEFELLDVLFAFEEMYGAESEQLDRAVRIREAFDVAVEEGIIEQSFIVGDDLDWDDDDEDNTCGSPGNIGITLHGRKKAHPFYAENRRLRFTHDSWKACILNVMLDERKREMHRHVAFSLEKDLGEEAHSQGDFEMQIRVFKHWKLGGIFAKAAVIALNIGGQLMALGFNTQAILLFDDALGILEEMASGDEIETHMSYGGIGVTVLEAIGPPELEYLIKLNISKGRAHSTLRQTVEGAKAYQRALDILNNTPCAEDEDFDRSVSFPIFSGLFSVLRMGAIEQDEDCSYEKDLCKEFVEQARLNGDPVHYGRAMAMQAETLGRLGDFKEALHVVEQVRSIYDIETQHSAICQAYGSDRVAQAFASSIDFNHCLGKTQEALDASIHIVDVILPKSDPKNVHNSFVLILPAIITMKENGLAMEAFSAFQTRIINPFNEHFGEGGTTWSKPMFKPILTMLDLQAREDHDTKTVDELSLWALDEEHFEQKMERYERIWASHGASPKAFLGEICFSLSRRHTNAEKAGQLLQKAILLIKQSAANKVSHALSKAYAKKKFDAMAKYQNRLNVLGSQLVAASSGEISKAMVAQDWEKLGHDESQLVAASDERQVMVTRASALLEHHVLRVIQARDAKAKIPELVKEQISNFVEEIAATYSEVNFHSLSHALHVTTSMNKLLSVMHDEEALNSFSLVFSALVHDAGHTGMSNKMLEETDHPLSTKYAPGVPSAERESIALAIDTLFQPEYAEFRSAIIPEDLVKIQYAKTLFQSILVTDIANSQRVKVGIKRYEVAQDEQGEYDIELCPLAQLIDEVYEAVGLAGSVKEEYPSEFVITHSGLQKCVRNEHMMLLSDVSHLLQGWENFIKWNFRLYKEINDCFQRGFCADPLNGWYEGQIGFLEHYILPLASRSSIYFDEDFANALIENGNNNLELWKMYGQKATSLMVAATHTDESEPEDMTLVKLYGLPSLEERSQSPKQIDLRDPESKVQAARTA
ncbi:hypothetical protein ACHAWF_018244 [Thalassiosira exigua]